MFKRAVIVALGAFTILTASTLGISVPEAKAVGCDAGRAPFSRWSNCDYDWQPDGSHIHCDAFFLFGIGGRNCFPVQGAAPPPPQTIA